jgi:DNA-directed RNA polymerase beta subunit
MCYSGYNVEDSIIFNEAALKRGIFRTTYYSSYEAREESSKVAGNVVDSRFMNIAGETVTGVRPGYDYNYLDENGLIRENTPLHDKLILIGKATRSLVTPGAFVDASVKPKKGQLGYVDKAFMTEGEAGFRIAKVRIREDRLPAIGDKFCSRAGQKGTIGIVLPEKDMPFTADGIRPDIIINPHAIPTRMTIGQLVECIIGKACLEIGAFGDCTPFVNRGTKLEQFGDVLPQFGFNRTGNELLYNGMTGEQLEADIFIGPTYYLRLKHMVKDKINYRARGPRTQLTRQTVHGRANDGGLRVGEMERDGIIAHGMDGFLNESMMIRGDEYYMAVCNKTGLIAVYNPSQNIFLSPMADGPLRFQGNLEGHLNVESISRYGRDFSIVRVPYTFKLLMQELSAMNVQMRIVTEDNIDQIMSLTYDKQQLKLNTGTTDYDAVLMNYQTARAQQGKPSLDTLQSVSLYFRDATASNYRRIRFTADSRDFSSRVAGADYLMGIINRFFTRTDVLRFTDGTSNIGTDALNVADRFYSVNAIEFSPETAAVLKNNTE